VLGGSWCFRLATTNIYHHLIYALYTLTPRTSHAYRINAEKGTCQRTRPAARNCHHLNREDAEVGEDLAAKVGGIPGGQAIQQSLEDEGDAGSASPRS